MLNILSYAIFKYNESNFLTLEIFMPIKNMVASIQLYKSQPRQLQLYACLECKKKKNSSKKYLKSAKIKKQKFQIQNYSAVPWNSLPKKLFRCISVYFLIMYYKSKYSKKFTSNYYKKKKIFQINRSLSTVKETNNQETQKQNSY